MDYPNWITLSDLGTYVQDYSFDLNPIVIKFSAGLGSTVSLLNGMLPAGLRYLQINNTIINIYGAVVESSNTIQGQWSFRITQTNGTIADRTFYITLTPLLVFPSWENQPTLLGYQSNVATGSYLLTATTTTNDHIYYDLPLSPSNSSINAYTGLLTVQPSGITVNTTLDFLVRATDSGTAGQSNVTVHVGIVATPGPPQWITQSGSLGIFYSGNFVEINLVAEDPLASSINYVLTEPLLADIGWGKVWDDAFGWDNDNYTVLPLTLAPDGLLYGRFPEVIIDTTYNFKVTAESVNGASTEFFSITNEPAVNNLEFYWNTTTGDLGTINEGQYADILIRATTTRGTTVIYNVTGGLLPPHLILGSTNGLIVGFVEYTAINKTYYFDVTAYDGYQYIVQQFNITVNKIYGNQFFNSYIPLTGVLRDQWASSASNVHVREPGTVVFDTITNLPNPPTMNIISGLITGFSTPDQIVNVISPWWHELNLQIGSAANTNVLSTGLSTIYRNITDSQFGSNTTISSNYVTGGEVYPISIDNIRNALIAAYPYVSSGSGTGLAIIPYLDWNTGAISSVTVVDSGTGYLSPPQIIVGGAGTRAVLQPVLGLTGVSVYTSGSGWIVGDTFAIPGNDAMVPAEVTVTQVNNLGYIVSLEVTLAGNYVQVGTASIVPVIYGYAVASLVLTWGIVAVDVVDGGSGYQCGITFSTVGGELLPPWQTTYFPAIEVGEIPLATANLAADQLNTGSTSLYGTVWQPTIMVLQWQGLRWIGSTTFDNSTTTFDGDTTRFQDTESPRETIFDDNTEIFDLNTTIFDYQDPLAYDLFQVWGSTLIDAGTTVFDLYSTIIDALGPRKTSNTLLQKWITTNNKIYSGNNAIW